jgi:hypothetical protein
MAEYYDDEALTPDEVYEAGERLPARRSERRPGKLRRALSWANPRSYFDETTLGLRVYKKRVELLGGVYQAEENAAKAQAARDHAFARLDNIEDEIHDERVKHRRQARNKKEELDQDYDRIKLERARIAKEMRELSGSPPESSTEAGTLTRAELLAEERLRWEGMGKEFRELGVSEDDRYYKRKYHEHLERLHNIEHGIT